MDIQSAQTVYFSGIGGIGMSALAQLLHEDGVRVRGSDIAENEMTRRLTAAGIDVVIGQDGSGITPDIDIVIYTSAVPDDHPEKHAAQEYGVVTFSYFEALGQYMRQFKTAIAISGTHGKSTTTAMIANVLIAAEFDPTVVVGTVVKEFNSNARHGGKEYIIVEACEHKEHMLNLHPNMIVLTNIEEDHLDHYRDLEHIVMTFQKYVNHLPSDGVLVKNMDDSEVTELGCDAGIVMYGIENEATNRAEDIHVQNGKQKFNSSGTEFTLNIPGRFNVYNALAAIAIARALGIDDTITAKALKEFSGVWRRFEIVGQCRGAIVISDYAHHPTAIHSTINAAREFYPRKRIVVAFQPHQRSRTEKLFNAFADSFAEADFVIIQEIYDVAGREEGQHISSTDLIAAVEKRGKYAWYAADAVETKQKIMDVLEKNDVLLIMGAGDIYKIAEDIIDRP